MTIECYFKYCKFHSWNTNQDEGPFCFQYECQATPRELDLLAALKHKDAAMHGFVTTSEIMNGILNQELQRTIPRAYEESAKCRPLQEPST